MNYVYGDLLAMPGVLVIPTNTGKVHGAGLAKLAKQRGIIDNPARVFQLDVKRHWRDRVDVELMKSGLRLLIITARRHPNTEYYLPLVGLGHGEGDPEEILPYLKLTAQDNITLVLPTADALRRTPRGTARRDRTAQNMPHIQELLGI